MIPASSAPRGFAILCLALGSLALRCPGREYYLDGRVGSDDATGDSTDPWRTLAPLSKVTFNPGDTIFFGCNSKFEGGVEVRQSGTPATPITLKRYGKGAPPRFTNPNSVVLSGNAIRVDASFVTVEGLEFESCPSNPVATDVHLLGAVFLTTNANHCIVRGCEMVRTPIGITVYGQSNLITGNYIHDNNAPIQPHWGPIGIVVCGSHNELSYNRIVNYAAPSQEYGHDGGAIEINDRSLPKESISIHHNLSLRNQGFIEFRHNYNLFYRTDRASISKQANQYAYERKYLGGGAQLRAGDRIGDPLFRDLSKYDFRLKAGSPAIGSGTNLGYSVDFRGSPMPTAAPPDIGAYEFVPGSKATTSEAGSHR